MAKLVHSLSWDHACGLCALHVLEVESEEEMLLGVLSPTRVKATEKELGEGVEADEIWRGTEGDFLHCFHQLIEAVARERLEHLALFVEGQEEVGILAEPLNQNVVLLIRNGRLDVFVRIFVDLKTADAVVRVVVEEEAGATSQIVHRGRAVVHVDAQERFVERDKGDAIFVLNANAQTVAIQGELCRG